jgi:hypothetical protein
MSANFHIHCTSDVMMVSVDLHWDHQQYSSKLADAMLLHSEKFTDTAWAVIDDIRNWPVKSPREIEQCTEVASQMLSMGMTNCAICVEDLAVSKWMMKKIVSPKVNMRFFDTIEACKAWLTEQGFDTEFGHPITSTHDVS